MPEITKALRLSEKEWNLITTFIEQNPFFDFSTLARTAIKQFILNPNMEIKAVKLNEKSARIANAGRKSQ
jgi:hypothetical protein